MCYHPSNQHIRVNPYSTYHPSPRQPSRQTEGPSNLILDIHYGFLGWQANKCDYYEYSIHTLHSEIRSWLKVRELRGIMDCRCAKSISQQRDSVYGQNQDLSAEWDALYVPIAIF